LILGLLMSGPPINQSCFGERYARLQQCSIDNSGIFHRSPYILDWPADSREGRTLSGRKKRDFMLVFSSLTLFRDAVEMRAARGSSEAQR
jgi:hypothetical protein